MSFTQIAAMIEAARVTALVAAQLITARQWEHRVRAREKAILLAVAIDSALKPDGDGSMTSGRMIELFAAAILQFTLNIVDPSILAQPPPANPDASPGTATIGTKSAPTGNAGTTLQGSGQSAGTAGALQQGATQPIQPK